MLELYHHSTSVCAAKVRLALHEKGLAWTGHFMDLTAGDQFKPEYLKINPKAVVPTLVDDGRIVRESTVINEYIDDAFAAMPLKPADAYARARMRLWTKVPDEGLHLACTDITYATQHRHAILKLAPDALEAFLAATPEPQWRERKRRLVLEGFAAPFVGAAVKFHDKVLAEMEVSLADGPWLAGAGYSLADIALTPYVNRLAMFDLAWMWRERPRVGDWFERVRARANFKPAVLSWIPDALAGAMRKNGAAARANYESALKAAA